MADPTHLGQLQKGPKAWNEWRTSLPLDWRADLSGANLEEAVLIRADLSRADLSGAYLCDANLSRAYLCHANLDRVKLNRANLSRANLSRANLYAANLQEANLFLADLSEAVLFGADLNGANFYGANLARADLNSALLNGPNLSRADLSGAYLGHAVIGHSVFVDLDLRTVRGLTTAEHVAPSHIGIDTIYQSGGDIPEVFLRGAGVPEEFVTYMKSLVGKPIEFYSLFISYATTDQAFAERLHADLQAKDVRCWFAPHDIQGGKKIHEQIDEAIRLHDKLLLILSPASMASKWVKTEISKARKREEREQRRVLFPVRLVSFEAIRDWECFDGDVGIDSAAEIREYFIPDFSNSQTGKTTTPTARPSTACCAT